MNSGFMQNIKSFQSTEIDPDHHQHIICKSKKMKTVFREAIQAAQVTLAAAGLTIGRTAGVHTLGATPGTVYEQFPAAGQRVGRASTVDLFLAISDRTGIFLMPDLTYRDYDGVRRFFEVRGFRLGSVK